MLLKKGIILTTINKVAVMSEFAPGDIIWNQDISPSMKVVRKSDKTSDSQISYSQLHLYLFVSENAEAGDYIMEGEPVDKHIITVIKESTSNCRRLVATTNKNIPSARLSKSFLNEYVEKDGITDVEVVYVETADKLVVSKNKRNIIELGSFKEHYTGVEVVEKIMELVSEVYEDDLIFDVKEWCDNNI